MDVMLVQFDKFNRFYTDQATIYMDIKNNATCLKSLSRMITNKLLNNCILHWEGAPPLCNHCNNVSGSFHTYEQNARY